METFSLHEHARTCAFTAHLAAPAFARHRLARVPYIGVPRHKALLPLCFQTLAEFCEVAMLLIVQFVVLLNTLFLDANELFCNAEPPLQAARIWRLRRADLGR